jgi:dTDP-4-dehydrorhamnose reductase
MVLIAAAYTMVDQAEDNQALAEAVNVDGPAAIAVAAREIGARVVHVSTDYVFDGTKGTPYQESDLPSPLNVYGKTKLAGETAVLEAHSDSVVLRASWVFDAVGRNFLRAMLRLGGERGALRIVKDQVSAPTFAVDLARALWRCAEFGGQSGLYHFQSTPYASWADFAEAIFDHAEPFWGRRPTIERIQTKDFSTRAPRPLDTRLNGALFCAAFGLPDASWRAMLPKLVQDVLAPNKT